MRRGLTLKQQAERLAAAKQQASDAVFEMVQPGGNGTHAKISSQGGNGYETSKTLSKNEESLPQNRESNAFPLDCLPKAVKDYVYESALACDFPTGAIAGPLLAVLAGAIGNKRICRMKDRWEQPSILWVAIVGNTGCGKSPCLKLATRIIESLHNQKLKQWKTMVEVYRAELDAWHAAGKNRGDKPTPPVARRYLVNDCTLEKLVLILEQNPAGVIQVRDELGGWIKSHDAYRDGLGGDREHFLSMYDGNMVIYDRKGLKDGCEQILHIDRASVSIIGGIQPQILSKLWTEENIANGLAGRFLYVLMEDKPRRLNRYKCTQETESALENLIRHLIEYEDSVTPEPRRLSREAYRLYRSFHSKVERARVKEQTPELQAAWSKLESVPLRISLILHTCKCFEDSSTPQREIDVDCMERAIKITKWFGWQAKSIYSLIRNGGYAEARKVYKIIEAHGGAMTACDLMRSCRKYRDSVLSAEDALNDLKKRGWGDWGPWSTGPGKKTRYFIISKDAVTKPSVS